MATTVSLNTHLDMSGSECLNMSDDHPLENCLLDNGSFLKSDCDEQLILSLAFNQVDIMKMDCDTQPMDLLFVTGSQSSEFEDEGALQ